MKRAEIWTVSGGADYAGKPRPAVIIQDDHFDTDSVTICPFTTDPTDAPLIRLVIEPNQGNGLDTPSRIMVDKVTTVRRAKLGRSYVEVSCQSSRPVPLRVVDWQVGGVGPVYRCFAWWWTGRLTMRTTAL